MKTNVRWMGPGTMRFIADTGSGHLIGMDGAPEGGGDNLAARPMELMLAGAGGCTAYDVVLILKKGRHDVRGCQVQLEADPPMSSAPSSSPTTSIAPPPPCWPRQLPSKPAGKSSRTSKTDPSSRRGRCTRHARPGACDGPSPGPFCTRAQPIPPPRGTSHQHRPQIPPAPWINPLGHENNTATRALLLSQTSPETPGTSLLSLQTA